MMIRIFTLILVGVLGLMQTCFAVETAPDVSTHHTETTTTKSHKKSHKISHKHHRKVTHTIKSIPNDRRDVSESVQSGHHFPSFSFATSIGEHIAKMVYKTVDTLRYSVYKLGGTHYDPSNGVYIVDCSEYVDNILQQANPNAYSNLVDWTGTYKPTTLHYYEFINELAYDQNNYWNKVNDATKLQPGDILVFRNKHHLRRNATEGHIMVVMDKPVADEEGYQVRVADSAPVGHSQDTRQHHVSGIGIGTLLLKINPRTGQPSAYAWKVGSHWVKNVNFAMARPVGMMT